MIASKQRILVVDDDARFLECISRILASRGFEVQTALFGKFALAALEVSDFNLVIVDINMPEMDGIELIRGIRQLKAGQRIIVITGYPSLRTKRQAKKLGSLDYLNKPVSPEHLIEVINEVLEKPKEQKKGLAGSIELTSEELIQLYALGHRTAVLQIESTNCKGRIYFKNGNPVHAEVIESGVDHSSYDDELGEEPEYVKLHGEEAFFEIQSWELGKFTNLAYDETVARTIEHSVNALLLEGARRTDELAKKRGKLSR